MSSKSLAALLMVCLMVSGSLTGCGPSKYGEQTTKVDKYPVCYEPIKKMRDEEHSSAKSAAVGAGIGAVGGALIGYAAGGGKGAAIGAVAGAAAGGAAGYYYGEKQKIANENERMSSYMRDLDGDISGLNVTTASARMSIQCYQQEFNSALAQYKKGTISKDQLQASYTEIKSGLDEAQRILGIVITDAQQRDAQYVAAIDEEAKTKGAPVKRPRKGSAPTYSGQLGEVKSKQVAYQRGIADAQRTAKEANDFSARMAENMS